ncbi:hypothetical protein DPEC_G00367560 [Dallia pectoralis]|nr:hypothetical protein DPEC_G00367560 [Dallia pectoralis]
MWVKEEVRGWPTKRATGQCSRSAPVREVASGQHGQAPGQAREHASRRNLQVDFSSSGRRSVLFICVSRLGVTPTSPYPLPDCPHAVSSQASASTTELTNSRPCRTTTPAQCRPFTVCNCGELNP